MRGYDTQQSAMFSYLSPEDRVPAGHALRQVRAMTDEALKALSPVFNEMYASLGRPSIAPEKLLRALLLQVLYTIRSERMLMEQLEYNLLFRWFIGLNMDEPVWVPTVFSKNRDRLMAGDVAEKFFAQVLVQATAAGLVSDELFSGRIRRSVRPRMIRAIRQSIFTVKRAAMRPTSRRQTRMRGWRARAGAMSRSWRPAATC